MLPLQREGLIVIEDSVVDRRSKELHLTRKGGERLRGAFRPWREAQTEFTRIFGEERAAKLRKELRALASSELATGKPPR